MSKERKLNEAIRELKASIDGLEKEVMDREVEIMQLAAQLAAAKARVEDLQAENEDHSRFISELLVLNAAGYYSNVNFQDDGYYVSMVNRIRISPVNDDMPPPTIWRLN